MSAGKFNKNISESAAVRVAELKASLAGDVDLNEKFRTTSWESQSGTLGGGNHFIEICLDEEETVWVTLHSGSRGIGNKIGMNYIGEAQKFCKKTFVPLPDRDLAYLPEHSEVFNEYIKYMRWAQHFALLNREEMMDRVLRT